MSKLASLIKHSFGTIADTWPAVKYCSLGLYSAWILLVMGGGGIVAPPEEFASGMANNLLYLYSGVPLSASLLLSGLFHNRIAPYVVAGPFVPLMALLASLCTLVVAGGFGSVSSPAFIAASIGTGVGTSFLCLRIGSMYSEPATSRMFFSTFSSGLLANLVYFMCVSISPAASILVLSSLPVCAALLTLLKSETTPCAHDDSDIVPISMLPKGFFGRSILVVGVFATAVGVVKGMATLSLPTEVMSGQGIDSVFASFVIVSILIVVLAVTQGIRRYDISKLYYPVIIIAALGILLSPLLGDHFRAIQALLVNTSYNLFVLTFWCLFSSIAGQTSLDPIRVFGLGRGMSATGTTLGQCLAGIILFTVPNITNEIAIVMAILVLVVSMIALNEGTIGDALDRTFRENILPGPSASSDVVTLEEARQASHRAAAEKYRLTTRELEVMALLSRGRTAAFIAEELHISVNTAKGHIRNLYAHCGVHSRQELINLVEEFEN